MNNRVIGWPRGRVLGGSSAINYMMMTYPSSTSLDVWEALGNPGWNWATLAPYYRKFQTYNPPSAETAATLSTSYIDPSVQGTSGPIQTAFYEFHGAWSAAWPETYANLSHAVTGDPLTGTSNGGFHNPSTLDPKTVTRSYAASGYYFPNASRPNLHLLTNAHACKILFSTSSPPKATALRFIHDSTSPNPTTHTLPFTREIILSAGTVQSPQLLELSGIGSPAILTPFSIPIVHANTAVGANLFDHMACGISLEVAPGMPSLDGLRDPTVLGAAIAAYTEARTGPLAAGCSASAYMPVALPSTAPGASPISMTSILDQHPIDDRSTSDVTPRASQQIKLMRELLSNPSEPSAQHFLIPLQFDGTKSELPASLMQPTEPGEYCSVFASLAYPFSRGSIHVRSADPLQPPAIDPNYLSNALDEEIYAHHLLFLEELTRTPPLKALFKENGRRVGGEDGIMDSVEKAKRWLRKTGTTQYHPIGTCAMGPEADGGVVDDRLRVHGVTGVRVVDASVFAGQVRGNIISGVYAVAERAADLVKEDWGMKMTMDRGERPADVTVN